MLRKILITCFCVGCWMTASAQTSLETLKTRYEADKRNFEAVKEYATALEDAKQNKEAEIVIREYMSRCPVLQIEDKDTYLLINRYVFDDPYSEVFGHAIYAWKKMRWNREEEKSVNARAAMMMNIFKGMSRGVTGGNQIDKRYEVLSVLSDNLHKEIDKQCTPQYKNKKYEMPVFDAKKVNRLEYQLNRGELLGQTDMRLKIDFARAWDRKDWEEILHKMEAAVELGIDGIGGDYALKLLTCLSEIQLNKEQVKRGLDLALSLCEHEEKTHGGINFYNLVGKWYILAGDSENAEKYNRIGDEIEAKKMEKYGDLLKLLQDNQ